jgi:NADH-quinone oxidoreductase subunit C
VKQIDPAEWATAFATVAADGYGFFDFLTVIDRVDWLEILARVVNPDDHSVFLASTRLEAVEPRIASLSMHYPGATWHEREAREMFGVEFIGLVDDRPLLLRDTSGRPPLLKDRVLVARVAKAWPGAAEPEVQQDGRRVGNPSRRRQRPPGVPEDFLREPQ